VPKEEPGGQTIDTNGTDSEQGGEGDPGAGAGASGARRGGLCAIGIIGPMGLAMAVLGLVKRSRRR
jgi:hypothetical protein